MQSFNCQQQYVPERAPFLWVILNGICAVASIFLLTFDFFGLQITSVYMAYNLARTTVWCLKIGLTLGYLRETRPTWQQFSALAVAFYFLLDTGRLIFQRARQGLNKSESLVIFLSIDVILLTIAWIDAIIFWRKKEQEYASLDLRENLGGGEDPWSTKIEDDEITMDFEHVDDLEMI